MENIDELVKAVQTLNADDAFRARLTLDNWRTIAPYLARYDIRAGDLLIKQGDADRSMYFLAQGSMQIFMTGGPPGSSKVAIRGVSPNRPGSPTTAPARRIATLLLPGGPPVMKICMLPWARKYIERSASPCLMRRSPARIS